MYADFASAGYNDRMKYYSVYTGDKKYFSRLGRVQVTLDSEAGNWSCICPSSGEYKQCIHGKMVCCGTSTSANAHPQQVICFLLLYIDCQNIEKVDYFSPEKILPDTDKQKMDYYINNKVIPGILPDNLLHECHPPYDLIPSETLCPKCGGRLDDVCRKKERVYGIGKVYDGACSYWFICVIALY